MSCRSVISCCTATISSHIYLIVPSKEDAKVTAYLDVVFEKRCRDQSHFGMKTEAQGRCHSKTLDLTERCLRKS